jgi:hypothetical protein
MLASEMLLARFGIIEPTKAFKHYRRDHPMDVRTNIHAGQLSPLQMLTLMKIAKDIGPEQLAALKGIASQLDAKQVTDLMNVVCKIDPTQIPMLLEMTSGKA